VTGLSPGSASGRVGGSFFGNNAIAAGAVQIVAPASNVNGVYIRKALLAVTTGTTTLTAGTVAPTTLTSNNTISASSSTNWQEEPRDTFVIAGQGVWVFASAAGGAAFLSYDIC